MKKIPVILFIFCLFFEFVKPQNIIHQVYDLDILINEIENLDKDSLVIFDVGNVIMYRPDKCFINPIKSDKTKIDIFDRYEKYLTSQGINKKLHEKEKYVLWANIKSQARKELVDPYTPILIKKLQKKGIKVIALTRIENITNEAKIKFEKIRVDMLANFGINFNHAFPSFEYIEFDKFKAQNSIPTFRNGVLFADMTPKGEVLSEFFKKICWQPKKVICIDDYQTYLDSISSELKKLKIDFIGLRYLASEKFKTKVDLQIYNIQVQKFFETGKWLSDEKAKLLIQ